MSEVKFIFSLEGIDSLIQSTKEEKIKDICIKYISKIDKKFNSFLFLYEGKQIDFDLSFDQLANQKDRTNNEMKIFVLNTELNGFICPVCDKEKIRLNKEKINEILLSNNNIINTLNEVNLIIENIIKNSTINDNMKNINKLLNKIKEKNK